MKTSPHLVPLKPAVWNEFTCPRCGKSAPEAKELLFPGVHVLAEYRCANCEYEFIADLPVGFAVDHGIIIGAGGEVHDPNAAEEWVTGPLLQGYRAQNDEEVRIERKVFKACKRVVVLNTLDFLYGHVLLKLWNAQYYLDAHADLGLVLILPRSFEWLVPKGTAEVWLVDQKLSKAHGWYNSIDRQVKRFLPDFDEVYLGKGYAHPDKSKVDIERFTDIAPFALEEYLTAPKHITFVLREDRLWYRSALTKNVHRAMNRLGLRSLARSIFVADQQRLALSSLMRIRNVIGSVEASIVGLGDARPVPAGVKDLRTRAMNVDTERTWCRAYARSQFVIGVHGSNMLLPTAFAAGCIEILPHDRFRNIVQDVTVRYNDVMQLFLYRFADEFASGREVARHAISLFNHYKVFYRNNRINVPDHAQR